MPTVPERAAFAAQPEGAIGQRIGLTPTPAAFATPQFNTPQAADPHVSPDLTPGVSVQAATNGTQGARQDAQEISDFGKTLTAAGGTVGEVAATVANQANVLRVNDSLNQIKEARLHLTYDKDSGFTNLKGYSALNRPDGKPLADEYLGKLDDTIQTTRALLSNDQQRQMFDVAAGTERVALENQAVQHEAQQFQEYNQSVQEGTIATSTSDLEKNYTNPDLVSSNIERINGAVYAQGQLLGKSASWIEAKQRDMTSAAHKVVIAAALEQNNIPFADAYMKAHKDQMNGDDLLRVQGLITKEVDGRMGLIVAGDVASRAAPLVATNDIDRLANIVMNVGEGTKGLDRDSQGRIITSPKGAQGSMQVMPETMRNPGLPGVQAIDPDTATDAQRAAFGKQYLGALVQKYAGDTTKAMAAYNAGFGAVDRAIEQAADPKNAGKNYLSFLPKETQDYAERTTKAYAAGAGAFQKPSLMDMMNAVRADPRIAGNPERLRVAEAETSRRYEEMNKSVEDKKTQGLADAYSALQQNGGNYMALPASIRANIDPAKATEVMDYASKIAKGQPPETNWSLYYELKSNAHNLPAVNLMAVRPMLADGEFKELTQLQQDVKAGKDSTVTDLQTGKDIIDQKMREVGINPSPKAGAMGYQQDAQKVGQIWSAFDARVRAQEGVLGRKLTSADLEKEANGLFATVQVGGIGSSHWFASTTPIVQVDPSKTNVVVPGTDRTQIINALRTAKQPVSEEAIQRLYLQRKSNLARQ